MVPVDAHVPRGQHVVAHDAIELRKLEDAPNCAQIHDGCGLPANVLPRERHVGQRCAPYDNRTGSGAGRGASALRAQVQFCNRFRRDADTVRPCVENQAKSGRSIDRQRHENSIIDDREGQARRRREKQRC